MDICQSVLPSFFVRAANGQFDLEKSDQLVRLLVKMARHKLLHHVTDLHAQRRDIRRDGGGHDGPRTADPPSPDPSPSRIASGRELLEEFRRRLSADEREVADRRAEGSDWATIAAQLGRTAEGRRRQLARALDRVSEDLQIDRGLDP